MAGIALILDLLKRKQSLSLSTQSIHSYGLFSATAAASAAAASIAAGRPFLSRALFGDGGIPVAYCDAGEALDSGYIPDFNTASEIFPQEFVQYGAKKYPVELKPLFSAFGFKSLAITSVRSFLLFYLPLLEPRPSVEDNDDFSQENPEEKHVDLVVPFKNSLKHISREVAVVTTRRVLERLVVHHVSQRMAWKLLKDVRESARRKASRGMPNTLFVYSVIRTTFRGHLLGVAASWLIQIIIEVYRCIIRKPENEDDVDANTTKKIRLLGKKVCGATLKCAASLVFASIGAGIGALFHPSNGQWIGCAIGDFAGPIFAVICFEKLHLDL